jgi:hypothetical protein
VLVDESSGAEADELVLFVACIPDILEGLLVVVEPVIGGVVNAPYVADDVKSIDDGLVASPHNH